MSTSDELIPCPGGCGTSVHRDAEECPHCGFRAKVNRFDNLLASLSTISSILTGFGLSALVQLASIEKERRDDLSALITTGLWIVSSVLLLSVLICSEVLRRREVGGRMLLATAEEVALWGRTQWLLSTFALALGLTATGVVTLGFFFSVTHGVVGCVAVLVGYYVLRKVW
jgi:hypothetical protein